jgi:hypothetical protein
MPPENDHPTRAEFAMLLSEVKETKVSVGGLYEKIDDIKSCIGDSVCRANFEDYKRYHAQEHEGLRSRISPAIAALLSFLSAVAVGLTVALLTIKF